MDARDSWGILGLSRRDKKIEISLGKSRSATVKEVDMLVTKMDLHIKLLEDRARGKMNAQRKKKRICSSHGMTCEVKSVSMEGDRSLALLEINST